MMKEIAYAFFAVVLIVAVLQGWAVKQEARKVTAQVAWDDSSALKGPVTAEIRVDGGTAKSLFGLCSGGVCIAPHRMEVGSHVIAIRTYSEVLKTWTEWSARTLVVAGP